MSFWLKLILDSITAIKARSPDGILTYEVSLLHIAFIIETHEILWVKMYLLIVNNENNVCCCQDT